MASILTPVKGVSKQDCMASKEGKSAKRLYREYTAGSKTIMPNEVPVGLNVSWQLEKPVARSKLVRNTYT